VRIEVPIEPVTQKIVALVHRSSLVKTTSTSPPLSLQFTQRSRIQASIPPGESDSP
jgi:hypothetical protein